MELDNILQSYRRSYGERFYNGLERIKIILEILENPQNDFLAIHVAGTNGKGSISSNFSYIFQELGLKTGLFTSPHLERFTERVKVDNLEINKQNFLDILKNKVIPATEKIDKPKYDTVTEFELVVITAFCYFSEQKVDIAIIEAGLGGRFDATNILSNILFSVITNISIDHTERLGSSLKEITYHKVGIIKESVDVITTCFNSEIDMFRETIDQLNNFDQTFLHIANPNTIKSEKLNLLNLRKQRIYVINNKESIFYNKEIKSSLIAKYQKENISIVLKAMEVLFEKIFYSKDSKLPIKCNENDFIEKVINGIAKTKWSGRFEIFNYRGTNIVIDGAHNDNGMKSLVSSIKDIVNHDTKVITIFACNKDKEYEKMIDYISEITDTFIITKSHVEIKAKDPENISKYLSLLNKDNQIVKDYRQTIDFACKIISERNYNNKNVLICVCGSLYLVGGIREIIKSIED